MPVLPALRSWFDSWRGIDAVERGMAHQGHDLQLTRYDEKGWRATFYTTGMEHSITSATASVWECTPWHAVQGAARDTLRQAEDTPRTLPVSVAKPTKQDAERLITRVDRFVHVAGWPWRALRRALRKARPGA
jgi:hypothetical protein